MPQIGNPGTPGPGEVKPGPAAAMIQDLQVQAGNATAAKTPGTPEGPASPSATDKGGGTSPGPSSPSDQVLEQLEKMGKRMDAQARFLDKLQTDIKTDRTKWDDFEQRFSRTRVDPDAEAEPPKFDQKGFARSIAEGVLGAVREEFRPLVQQTKANALTQRVIQAQTDQAVALMVKELPAGVRANLTAEVYRVAGDKVFAEPDPLYDEPDPVLEAIEWIHFRTVVKAGRKTGAGKAEQPEETPVISPVPTRGTRTRTPEQASEEKEAEEFFQTRLGPNRLRYPEHVEADLGLG